LSRKEREKEGRRERERGKERERKRERGRCPDLSFLFFKSMMGALASFSYLVY
jgi:hypothetical protein